MPTVNLGVPYHQQDQEIWCGAACAQMVLRQIGEPVILQSDLYTRNHSHTSPDAINWATGPDGLHFTLNTLQGSKLFVIINEIDPDILSRKIVWTIFNFKVAPVVLVYSYLHWIVVTGYDISANPISEDDNTYTINSLTIHNPTPDTPIIGTPPPPHFDADRCGVGAPGYDNSRGDFGRPDQRIEYVDWLTSYLDIVPQGRWAGYYVAVCDPALKLKFAGRKKMHRRYSDGASIIDVKKVAKIALDEFKASGLNNDLRLKKFKGKLSPGQPFLVQRFDREDDFYYLIPLLDSNKIAQCLISIDARYGFLKESVFATGKEGIKFTRLSNGEIMKALGNSVYIKAEKLHIPIHPEAVCIYPLLVWRPCMESLSPFYPFHMVTVGQHRIFISLRKEIFRQVTIDIGGI